MKDEKERKPDDDSGKSFQELQQSTDAVQNTRIRNEAAARGVDEQMIRREKRVRATDTSQKRTGSGEQKSVGD